MKHAGDKKTLQKRFCLTLLNSLTWQLCIQDAG
jgi:hypothetical protein